MIMINKVVNMAQVFKFKSINNKFRKELQPNKTKQKHSNKKLRWQFQNNIIISQPYHVMANKKEMLASWKILKHHAVRNIWRQ